MTCCRTAQVLSVVTVTTRALLATFHVDVVVRVTADVTAQLEGCVTLTWARTCQLLGAIVVTSCRVCQLLLLVLLT